MAARGAEFVVCFSHYQHFRHNGLSVRRVECEKTYGRKNIYVTRKVAMLFYEGLAKRVVRWRAVFDSQQKL